MFRHPGFKSRWLAGLPAGLLILAGQPGRACEPCGTQLGFEETVQKADLIVVGQQTAEASWTASKRLPGRPSPPEGPDWIEVRVDRVLKGSLDQKRIRANSWDGMCPYGFMLDKGRWILFLGKKDQDEIYPAVWSGCAVKAYRLSGKRVKREEGWVSFQAFLAEIREALRADGRGRENR